MKLPMRPFLYPEARMKELMLDRISQQFVERDISAGELVAAIKNIPGAERYDIPINPLNPNENREWCRATHWVREQHWPMPIIRVTRSAEIVEVIDGRHRIWTLEDALEMGEPKDFKVTCLVCISDRPLNN